LIKRDEAMQEVFTGGVIAFTASVVGEVVCQR